MFIGMCVHACMGVCVGMKHSSNVMIFLPIDKIPPFPEETDSAVLKETTSFK